MSKYVKQALSLLVVSLLLLSLVACGDNTPGTSEAVSDVPGTTTAAVSEKTTGTQVDAATTTETAKSEGSTTQTEAEKTTTAADKDEPVTTTQAVKDTTTKKDTVTTKTDVATTKKDAVTTKKVTTTTKKATTKSGKKTSLTADQFLAQMPSELRGTTINFLFWEDMKTRPYKAAIDEFEKKTGIRFNTVYATKDEYHTQLAALITAGNAPDMYKVFYNLPAYCTNAQPIDKATGYDFNDAAWDTQLMKDFTFNGRTYAANVQGSPDRNVYIIIYNKKALKRAGLSDQDPYTIWKKNPKDWTWDKFWDLCDQFVKANNNEDGYYGTSMWEGYVVAMGGGYDRYDSSKGKMVNLVNSNATVKGFQTVLDAISKKWATHTGDSTAFTSGKQLFSCSYSSIIEKNNGYDILAKQGNLGAVPLPTDSKYTPIMEYSAYAVPVGAKNAAAVPYFLRYVMDPKNHNLNDFYIDDEATAVAKVVNAATNNFYAVAWSYDINQALRAGTSSQVKSVLDSYVKTVQNGIETETKAMKNLPK